MCIRPVPNADQREQIAIEERIRDFSCARVRVEFKNSNLFPSTLETQCEPAHCYGYDSARIRGNRSVSRATRLHFFC